MFEKREQNYKNYAATYTDNPTLENWEGLTIAFEDVVDSQSTLQSTQDIVGNYKEVVPLGIKNFGANYDRLQQLRTGFKSLGANGMYLNAQMEELTGIFELKESIYGEEFMEQFSESSMVDLGEDIRKETSKFQESIKVDEIQSLKDAGRWLSSSTTQLLPSFSMALTGPMALPLFFVTGAGAAGLDVAIDQKNAGIRFAKNFDLLNDKSKTLDPFQIMGIEEEMKQDKKTLEITPGQKLTKQFVDGIAEVMFEKYGTMLLMRNVKQGIKSMGRMSKMEAFTYAGKGFIGGNIREGGSEWGTNAVQNFASIYVLDQNKNFFPEDAEGFEKFKGSFTGGLEVYAQGGLMGSGINSINGYKAVKQAIVSEIYTKADMTALNCLLYTSPSPRD